MSSVPDSKDVSFGQERVEHLRMILQMAGHKASNSDNLKRWCVSFSSAFLALSTQQKGVHVAYLALFPIFFLWMLDCHERYLYGMVLKLYDHVRELPDEMIDFNLNLNQVQGQEGSIIAYFFKPQLMIFYGSMAAGIFIVDWMIN